MKKSLKDLQSKYIPMYIAQPKPKPLYSRFSIALSRSIEILLHPALKRY